MEQEEEGKGEGGEEGSRGRKKRRGEGRWRREGAKEVGKVKEGVSEEIEGRYMYIHVCYGPIVNLAHFKAGRKL